MTVESAFTTSNPEVLEVHRQFLADMEDFHVKREVIAEEFGRRVYFNNSGGSPVRIMGLEPNDEDWKKNADLPEGLRYDRKRRQPMLVPALRSARGKAIEKEWRAITVKHPRYPGMPGESWSSDDGFQSYIYWPNFHLDGDTLWCFWGTSAERVTGEVFDKRITTGFDPEIWQVRKLSEFYAMKEALKEAQDAART